jgi:glucosylceramidase
MLLNLFQKAKSRCDLWPHIKNAFGIMLVPAALACSIFAMTICRVCRFQMGLFLAGIVPLGLAPKAVAQAPSTVAPSIRWICSTPAEPWQERSATILASVPDAESNVVKLDPATTYQVIDGFGGCFNELGWDALQTLDRGQQATALKALFAADGCNFNLCRVGMGANDFAREWYSFDETPGDYAMTNFSIARDRTILIPFIKAAMQYQPGLAVWGVPWSPPAWMKTSQSYRGGNMKMDPPTLTAYALYFSKYVRAYRAEGVNLCAVYPQNEPNYNNNVYPQCAWNGPEINLFLRDYLVPQLKKDQVAVQVWLGTIVNQNLGDYTDPVLGDAVTAPAITGAGYQYGGQEALLATHQKYPAKKLMQTETECYNGANSWAEGLTTFHKIIQDMNHFANGYAFWNLVLSEKSTSSWGWKQNSLLKIDAPAQKIIFNPEFYSLKHFAHFLQPGAVRIGRSTRSGTAGNVTALTEQIAVAFRNPSGELVLMIGNRASQDLPVTVCAGTRTAKLNLPGQSMNTVVLTGW